MIDDDKDSDEFCDNCRLRIGGIIMSDDLIHCGECGRKLISEKVYGDTMKWK